MPFAGTMSKAASSPRPQYSAFEGGEADVRVAELDHAADLNVGDGLRVRPAP